MSGHAGYDREEDLLEGAAEHASALEMESLRTAEDFGPLDDLDPEDPDVQAWWSP